MNEDQQSIQTYTAIHHNEQSKTKRFAKEDLRISARSIPWRPPTDVYETDTTYVVVVEVAGMTERSFDISVENQVLTIQGCRLMTSEKKVRHLSEIQSGDFETSPMLPTFVDTSKATVNYENGFLRMTFYKLLHISA
jgi:HSP20 family protein